MKFDSDILHKNYKEKLEQAKEIFTNYCNKNIPSIIEKAMDIYSTKIPTDFGEYGTIHFARYDVDKDFLNMSKEEEGAYLFLMVHNLDFVMGLFKPFKDHPNIKVYHDDTYFLTEIALKIYEPSLDKRIKVKVETVETKKSTFKDLVAKTIDFFNKD